MFGRNKEKPNNLPSNVKARYDTSPTKRKYINIKKISRNDDMVYMNRHRHKYQ